MDQHFKVELIAATPNPQQVVYAAMHQDYSEGFVWDERDRFPPEPRAGELCVKHLLEGNKGHFGPYEHPQIVLNCGWFPHSVMQQLRTHRHLSMDVQSGRYTGERVLEAVRGERDFEEVFYFRPEGWYTDRKGKRYEYGRGRREGHKQLCFISAKNYLEDITSGLSEEHARDMLLFNIRQHWVLSLNARSLMHLLTIRGKRDAQLEIQQLCQLILPHFQAWMPETYEWFMAHQWQKGRLAP